MSITPPRDEAAIAVRQRVYHDAGRVAVWGLGVNGLLAVTKLAGGIIFASSALIADAVNSIGDVASGMAVRGALSVAQIAEDDDHPYGHTKAESIAGLGVALLVAFSAGMLAIETLQRFFGELRPPSVLAGIVATACAIIKEASYRYTSRTARRLGSSALKAAAWDHRSDAIASAAVGASLLAAPHLGRFAPYVDPVAALVVCLVLVVTGMRLFAMTAAELMDQQASEEVVTRVRGISELVDGVIEVEKLRVRKSGLEYFIEIHVQVEGTMTVNDGHRIGHDVKDQLLMRMPRVRDVHVHVEPHESDPTSS